MNIEQKLVTEIDVADPNLVKLEPVQELRAGRLYVLVLTDYGTQKVCIGRYTTTHTTGDFEFRCPVSHNLPELPLALLKRGDWQAYEYNHHKETHEVYEVNSWVLERMRASARVRK